MAPVILRLRRDPLRFETVVCATAQHREMLDSALSLFGIEPDLDLDLMRPDQSPNDLAARSLAALDRVISERRADWLLVQGDTTTAMCAAVAAFHRRVRVGHVEAGLRTGDLQRPFPEEMNRRVVDLVADACYAPTRRAATALANEGVPADRIHVTGNTVVDALEEIAGREGPVVPEDLALVTAHRRESFGEPLGRVLAAVNRLAAAFPATRFVHVVHPNPSVREAVARSVPPANVERVEALDYRSFVRLLRACRLVLTDSGGVQEEAPAFGKPVLVLREKTERPEGIEAGLARLVGTDEERIFEEGFNVLSGRSDLAAGGSAQNPYGDGRAADRIAAALADAPYEPFAAPAARAALV
jgi:UDP-N-acetylglucosamine 2-epimerase (non-hydrolysing)